MKEIQNKNMILEEGLKFAVLISDDWGRGCQYWFCEFLLEFLSLFILLRIFFFSTQKKSRNRTLPFINSSLCLECWCELTFLKKTFAEGAIARCIFSLWLSRHDNKTKQQTVKRFLSSNSSKFNRNWKKKKIYYFENKRQKLSDVAKQFKGTKKDWR